MTYESLFVNPGGRTPRGAFIGGLATLIAVAAFYYFVVTGRTAHWGLAVLIFPAIVLHARRLHDMGMTAWLLVLPGGLLIATAWLKLVSPGTALETPVAIATAIASIGFAAWGIAGRGQAAANRFGEPAAA